MTNNTIKKHFSLVLAVVMFMTFYTPVFASEIEEKTESKSIDTIVMYSALLECEGTDVIKELDKQINRYEELLDQSTCKSDENQIQDLIIATKQLREDYLSS